MANGILGEKGEHDWLAVTLSAGQAYEFTITGLSDDALTEIGVPAALDKGVFALQTQNVSGAVSQTQNIWFTPDTTGTYYVDISDPATIGGYSVSAVAVPNDFPDNTTTTGVITVGGGTTSGMLGETGEHDWLAVTLSAGQAYEFTITGLSNAALTEIGTGIGQGTFALQAQSISGAVPQTQNIWFTPDTTGTYYVDISDPATIGGYSVSAAAVPNDFPDNTTTTGVIAVGGGTTTGMLGATGEHDWLAVTLSAGQAYEFTITGLSDDALTEIGVPAALDKGVFALQTQNVSGAVSQTQNIWFTPDTTGTYYVDISDPATIGGYSVSAVAVPNDFPDNTTTTGVITVGGGTTSGMLGETGEHDWLAVTLSAGQAYEFTITGLSNAALTEIGTGIGQGTFALQAQSISGAVPQTQNIWFTPDTTGTYYVDISDPATIGGYSVSAAAVPNDFPDNTTTTGVIAVGGGTTTGMLGATGEHDWLAVTLSAGQAYEFTITGLSDDALTEIGVPAALDKGVFALQTQNVSGAVSQTQNIWFTPDTTGTYYVDISDPATIGGYSVSAVAVPNDFPDNTTTTGVVTVCFAQGTRIATPHGEVPVECLAVGDLVKTLGGEIRSVVWLGVGRVQATRGERSAATPVIVRKGALGDNVPHRDLRITKGHALHIDGALIPVEFLVNHRSILWDDRAQEMTIYHVELAVHDVLVADGAPAESYRDDGNRWLFQNANTGWKLPPKRPCAPILTGGDVVDRVWQRLLDRVGPRKGVPLTDDPDLHLLVDSRRIDAIERHTDMYVFRLRARPRTMRIRSRTGVPQELGLRRDPRSLGVAVRRVVLAQSSRQWAIEADAASLSDGFHAYETGNDIRWTNGDAAVPADLFAAMTGPGLLVLYLGCTTEYIDDGSIVVAA